MVLFLCFRLPLRYTMVLFLFKTMVLFLCFRLPLRYTRVYVLCFRLPLGYTRVLFLCFRLPLRQTQKQNPSVSEGKHRYKTLVYLRGNLKHRNKTIVYPRGSLKHRNKTLVYLRGSLKHRNKTPLSPTCTDLSYGHSEIVHDNSSVLNRGNKYLGSNRTQGIILFGAAIYLSTYSEAI